MGSQFDFICSFQALEHIYNDNAAIEGISQCCKKGGNVLISVPSKLSFFLYGRHGFRGYSKRDIVKKIGKSGLSVVEVRNVGGLATFVLHLLLWTIPSILVPKLLAICRVSATKTGKPWNIYNKYTFSRSFIAGAEMFAYLLDKFLPIPFGFGGYAIIAWKPNK